jgi:hypothetical protein
MKKIEQIKITDGVKKFFVSAHLVFTLCLFYDAYIAEQDVRLMSEAAHDIYDAWEEQQQDLDSHLKYSKAWWVLGWLYYDDECFVPNHGLYPYAPKEAHKHYLFNNR